MPASHSRNVLSCLDLVEKGAGTYVGENLELDYHRSRAARSSARPLRASLRRRDEGKVVKSLHQLFPREEKRTADDLHGDRAPEGAHLASRLSSPRRGR